MLHICYCYSLKTPNWILKIYDIYKGLHGVEKKSLQQIRPPHPSEVCELSEEPREPGGAGVSEEHGELGEAVLLRSTR